MKDMLGREEVITADRALELIFSNLSPKLPPEENLKIYKSHRRILSRDLLSPEDLPNFSRSTVDGFAVSAPDTFGATEGMPSYLNIRYEIAMGEERTLKYKKVSLRRLLPAACFRKVLMQL